MKDQVTLEMLLNFQEVQQHFCRMQSQNHLQMKIQKNFLTRSPSNIIMFFLQLLII